MTPLFSDTGLARLKEVCKPGLLCAFDFDGTLAPIVAQPDQAALPADLRRRLLALSEYTPVAIITGRALADIRERLGYEPDFIIGNHGIEGLPGWERRADDYRRMSRAWKEQLEAGLRAAAMSNPCGDPCVWIEDKHYSLSLHYRLARDPLRTEEALRRFLAGLDPEPRVVAGKYVLNLMPELADDKGSALIKLMEQCVAHSAIYIGDDVTDEDVFRLRRPNLLSVRVEQGADSAAEFFLRQWQDIARLLDEMIMRLSEAGASNWTHVESANSI